MAGVAVAIARSRRSRWQRVVAVLLAIGALTAGVWKGAHLQPAASVGVAPVFMGPLAGFLLIVLSRRA